MITAGTCYTIAASEDNVLYFWGTHYLKTSKPRNFNETYTNFQSNSSGSGAQLLPPFKDGENIAGSFTEVEMRFRRLKYAVPEENLSTFKPIVQIKPTPILALYASPENVKQGKIVWLAGISANDNSVSVLVHTTAPPPIKKLEDDTGGQSLLVRRLIIKCLVYTFMFQMNWNKSNRIYRNQTLPNTPQMS